MGEEKSFKNQESPKNNSALIILNYEIKKARKRIKEENSENKFTLFSWLINKITKIRIRRLSMDKKT